MLNCRAWYVNSEPCAWSLDNIWELEPFRTEELASENTRSLRACTDFWTFFRRYQASNQRDITSLTQQSGFRLSFDLYGAWNCELLLDGMKRGHRNLGSFHWLHLIQSWIRRRLTQQGLSTGARWAVEREPFPHFRRYQQSNQKPERYHKFHNRTKLRLCLISRVEAAMPRSMSMIAWYMTSEPSAWSIYYTLSPKLELFITAEFEY